MPQLASVIIATCGRPEKLGNCLRALAEQELPEDVRMEVIVAVDGGDPDGRYERLPRPGNTRFLMLPRKGISAARNAAMEVAGGEWMLTTNDDTYPSPHWVAEHLAAQTARGSPGLVVGLTEWRQWPAPTIFDGLVRDTSMIFFFDRMEGGRLYNFRHFWTCNGSLPVAMARAIGGFDTRIRPYGFEDLEFAYRVEGAGARGVYYHPAASSVHDHRLTFADYCRREACLGRMSACLWEMNAACFQATYERCDVEAMRHEFVTWLAMDRGDHARTYRTLRAWMNRPLASIEDWPATRDLLYRLHLPIKRRCFRAGFISGFGLRDDEHWPQRLARGHSFP